MSQSGNAALASQGQESALPSPSPSLLDLPDDPLEPPNTPRSHISTIRRIISAKKVKSTKLTLANFSEIFASLDALDQYLSNGKQLEDALSVFKVELLAELKKNAPAAPTTRSYSSAATSPSSALPTSPPHAPAPKPSPSKASKLTVVSVGTARLSLRRLLSTRVDHLPVLRFVCDTGRFPRYAL